LNYHYIFGTKILVLSKTELVLLLFLLVSWLARNFVIVLRTLQPYDEGQGDEKYDEKYDDGCDEEYELPGEDLGDEEWWQLLKLNSSTSNEDNKILFKQLESTFGANNVIVILGNSTNINKIVEFVVYMDPNRIPDLLDRYQKVVS